MKSSLTIRNAVVVLPGKIQKTDVSVINGVINAIGSEIPDVGEIIDAEGLFLIPGIICLLYTSPSPRDATLSRMPSSA